MEAPTMFSDSSKPISMKDIGLIELEKKMVMPFGQKCKARSYDAVSGIVSGAFPSVFRRVPFSDSRNWLQFAPKIFK